MEDRQTSNQAHADREPTTVGRNIILAAVDILLGVVICFLLAGGPVPDVNEAHYLAKAKHYWQPEWCQGDIFLESDTTHLAFCWTLGWVAAVFPLHAAAWILRVTIWIFLSWSMSRLIQTISPGLFRGAWALGLFTWTMMNFHMAGEWVVGGAEAKGVAYGLVLLAFAEVCRNRWNFAWCLLGAAAAFHVLVGGWSVIALSVAWLVAGRSRPRLLTMSGGLLIGGALALIGVFPALTTSSTTPEISSQAHSIYVYTRLPHHLVIHRFQMHFWIRFASLAVVTACLLWPLRKEDALRRLGGFALGAALIALTGLAIDQYLLRDLERAAELLRFYWYRLADFAIPLMATIGVLAWHQRLAVSRPKLAALILMVAIWTPIGWWATHRPSVAMRRIPGADRQTLLHQLQDEDFGVAQYLAWQNCCQWVRDNTEESLFITPRTQQTFKFYAHRAEAANWKDVPQDAESIVDWHTRLRALYPPKVGHGGLVRHSDGRLARLATRYDAQYIVVRRRSHSRRLDPDRFRLVYPNRDHANPYFQVFEVK